MIEHPFLQFDDEGRMQSDLSCIGCGYNLRSLRRDATCPECGKPVGQTIQKGTPPAWLAWIEPDWARYMSRGLMWFIAGLLVCSVAVLAEPLLSPFFRHYRR